MLIHAITEIDKPFVYLTTGKAFESLANCLDATCVVKDYRQWVRQACVNKDVDIFIFESVYLELLGISTTQLREIYPNAKLVAIASDSIYFILSGKTGGYQFNSPLDVDLFLDTMEVSAEAYRKKGVTVDTWMWTISDYLIDECSKYNLNTKFNDKEFDFIGVYNPDSISRKGSYRNDMVSYLTAQGLNFTQGGGSGHGDKDLNRLFKQYANSKFTLGTTSHNNPDFQTMKGFRDWIGPFMGSLLIYDDYPDVINRFGGGDLVPIYRYGEFGEIEAIHSFFKVKQNQPAYEHLLKRQRSWAINNTIEQQLVRLFKKHKICT